MQAKINLRSRKGDESTEVTIMQVILLLIGMIAFATIVLLSQDSIGLVSEIADKAKYVFDIANLKN